MKEPAAEYIIIFLKCNVYKELQGIVGIEKRRFGTVMSLILCVVTLCSCSNFSFDMFSPSRPPTQPAQVTTTETTVTETDPFSDLETDPNQEPLTDEQALTGFTNYLYFKIKNLQKILDEDKKPCTWGISSSDKKTIVIMFKSHTGALLRYYINRSTGKTYAATYVVSSNSYVRTNETLNIRDYIDKKPTPTPVVIKPSVSTTPTVKPAAKPKIKVSTAVNKTSTFGGSKHPYKIPKVSISGKNTNSVNSKMKKELDGFATKGASARSVTYTYHITSKVVSILVKISNNDTYTNYKVYNISVKSGKLMSDKALVKAAGSSTRKFFAKVKTTYKNFGGGSSAPAAEAKKCRTKNLKRVSYKYIDPYIGKSGHLCFVGYVDFYGGAGSGRRAFDSVKKKIA